MEIKNTEQEQRRKNEKLIKISSNQIGETKLKNKLSLIALKFRLNFFILQMFAI